VLPHVCNIGDTSTILHILHIAQNSTKNLWFYYSGLSTCIYVCFTNAHILYEVFSL
jgi:hypothetical protein